MTIFSAYNYTKKALQGAGIESFVFEAKQIIRYVTGYSNRQIMDKYQEPLDDIKESILLSIVKQRCTRYPLQYIIGEWSFFGYDFAVGEGVLCPRPDTEVLVETAMELEKDEEAQVADLCAGTGCVGITLALKNKGWKVLCAEKYEKAFSYLEKNITKNGADNVTAVLLDIANPIEDKKFDLVVSNPPYISKEEMEIIDEETKKEPHTALYGGEDGLDFYKIILSKWKPLVKSGGHIAVEIGINMENAVMSLFKEAGLTDINTKEDYSGIKRVVYGTVI